MSDESTPTADASLAPPCAAVVIHEQPASVPLLDPPHNVGLVNLGNTCYLNATLQVLAATPFGLVDALDALRAPAAESSNPLGTGGELVSAVVEVLRVLGDGREAGGVANPGRVKAVLGSVARRFKGAAQHDAQEVLGLILDKVAEDVNGSRMVGQAADVSDEVLASMAGSVPGFVRAAGGSNSGSDSDSGSEDAIAQDWGDYFGHNRSPVVGLFGGLLGSRVLCESPGCGAVSLRHDPFTMVAIPLPADGPRRLPVTVIRADPLVPFVQYPVILDEYEDMGMLKSAVGELSGVDPETLCMAQVAGSTFATIFADGEDPDDLGPNDEIYLYETAALEEIMDGTMVRLPVCHRVNVLVENTFVDPETGYPVDKTSMSSMYFGLPLMLSLPPVLPLSVLKTKLLDAMALYVDAAVAQHVPAPPPEFPDLASFNAWWGDYAATANAAMAAGGGAAYDSDYDSDYDDDGDVDPLYYYPPVPEDMPLSSARVEGVLFNVLMDGLDTEAVARGEDPDVVLSSDNYVVLEWNEAVVWNAYSLSKLADCEVDTTLLGETHDDDDDENACPSVASCLAKFSEPEMLQGSEAWYCPQCQDFGPALKVLSLATAPPVLVVHLKRFQQVAGSARRTKIEALIDFPVDEALVLHASSSPDPVSYSLYGVINHYGALGGGHYTALLRAPDAWRSYNDSRVTEIPSSRVVTPAAYLLFYHRTL